jgi:excisionase family DNA binding protein
LGNEDTLGPDDVLTFKEAEKYLKIPRSTLYKLLQEGRVPARKVGRHWRFVKKELDEWLKASEGGKAPGLIRPYCWHFWKKQEGEIKHKCTRCIVYRAKALDCFQLRDEVDYQEVKCQDDCRECAYYIKYFG